MTSKTCTKCGAEKPHSCFAKRSNAPDGLQHYCKECQKVKRKAYYEANKERTLKDARRWYDDNRERYTYNNRRSSTKVQVAAKQGVIVDEELTDLVVDAIHSKAIELEKITNIRWSLDHAVPLSKGGVHSWFNIQLMPLELNGIKSDLEVFIYDATTVYNPALEAYLNEQALVR